jgi:endo-1,4-beta-D-glucanase Y
MIARWTIMLLVIWACGHAAPAMPPAAAAASEPVARSCSLASGANLAAVRALYARWKTDLLTDSGAGGFQRVRRPNSGTQLDSTNSEGIAYGMLISVYMDDRATFDALWQYERLHLGANGLMEWEIAADGSVLGTGAATDGDEDMAFALVMAHARWRDAHYLEAAKAQIELIWRVEVDHTRGDQLMPGDQFDGAQVINLSYFAPAFYRVFGAATGREAEWARVVDSGYAALAATLNATNGNRESGLVPAWSTPEGVPLAPPNTGHPTHHQLDSCRTPFRLAQDYCWFGEARALTYLDKINTFHARVGSRQLLDGYQLDGSAFPGAKLHLAAFVAGAGAAAMTSQRFAAVRDDAYDELIAWSTLLGGSAYYNKSWSVLGAMMLTGLFQDLHSAGQ